MASSRLQGTELIDCVKANVNKEIAVAAHRCGYGEDIITFERELKKAGEHIGVEINSFNDFSKNQEPSEEEQGVVIAPETPTQL